MVLSACSSYFQSLFLDHPARHPIVILKDVHFSELRTLVDFMYKGEVNVEYCQLSALLKTAESLKVKGLAEMTNLNSVPGTVEIESGDGILQPQDLAVSRASTQPMDTVQTTRADDTSPPRSSPLLYVRRHRPENRHDSRHDPRHESRHETRHELMRHETRHEPKQEPRLEPQHEPEPKDLSGKEEPPDEIMRSSSPEDDVSSLHSNCGTSDNIGYFFYFLV